VALPSLTMSGSLFSILLQSCWGPAENEMRTRREARGEENTWLILNIIIANVFTSG
jgi:hypothetical protein